MPLSRRSFIAGLFAAPAIVRAESLMRVKALVLPGDDEFKALAAAYNVTKEKMASSLYEELCDVTRRAFCPRLFVKVYHTMPQIDWAAPEMEF